MKTYRCLIVEDEPLAQKVIQKHLAHYPELQLVGICENPLKAFEIMSKEKIDLLFLDITLPAVNGIDFIRSLKNPPAVIFTTAYSEYAVTSYELEAVDYLLKPITLDRFKQALSKFFRQEEKKMETEGIDFLFIKESGKLVKLFLQEILFIEARKDYLMIYLSHRSVITHKTMKAMEESLPARGFIRIHRSYIVSRKAVTGMTTSYVEIAEKKLPIGEKYKQKVMQEFKADSKLM
ncbi:MAG: response regulator transcription factor [Chitinophagaceae bacterium]|nr:response regulator transcription factor [Chitinophagaceae bacterium]